MPLVIPADVDPRALGIYNVKNFGALGDGITDDTVAIQTAINTAYTAGGGIVYLPFGRYYINGAFFTKASKQGDKTTGDYPGTTPVPKDHLGNTYLLVGLHGLNNGRSGTQLPNGPILLFDNVTLAGDGPEQTVLLAGSNIFEGWIISPNNNAVQNGTVVATVNWWSDPDITHFADGFFAHNVYVRDLSIDCQGSIGENAGKPSHVIQSGTVVVNPGISTAIDMMTPIGQLSDTALTMHTTQNCGIDNVWIYNGNVNGILVDGTQNPSAFADGPLPQSYQQAASGIPFWVPNSAPTLTNVPAINARITRCKIDMNYPKWLAGSSSSTGGSAGQLPIRALGAAAIVVAHNYVGQRNQPSTFPTPPAGTTNPPQVSPNTNDAMDCDGTWHILIFGNVLTNCGDGIGADGNGDMIVACNVMYNFGSVGFSALSNKGKSVSQTIVHGNTIFLGSDFGVLQTAIIIADQIPHSPTGFAETATPGSVVISNNVIYGPGFNYMIDLKVLGATVTGNVFDYGAIQPPGQPGPWPNPVKTGGIIVKGNDIIIEGNLFRNGNNPPGTPNSNAIGIVFPASFPPSGISPDSPRVLVKGNIFDKTIGVPVQDSTTAGLSGVRILDNIGANPPSATSLNPALVPFPASGATFTNPYAYDCFVTIKVVSTTNVSNVAINGVLTGSTIPTGTQKSFIVKAGGTIAVTYAAPPAPQWVWIGL